MGNELKELKHVKEGIFQVEPETRLLGGECFECNQKFFPKPIVCPKCLGELLETTLSPTGTINTYSVLSIPGVFNLPTPYAVGWVDLDDGLTIFTLFDPESVSDLEFNQRVSLRVGQIGVDNNNEPCLRYYFTPDHGGEQ